MVRTRSSTSKTLDKWTSFKSVNIYPISQIWKDAKTEASEKLKTDKGDAYNKICAKIYNRMYKQLREK